MKFNLAKAGTYTGTTIDDVNYRYGWYESGRAFIAKEDELMTYKEAYKTFVPKNSFNLYNAFFVKTQNYFLDINEVHTFVDDHCLMAH